MNNQQGFILQVVTALSENDKVASFSATFRAVSVNGEDELVPDVQVVKKEIQNGNSSNS